MGLAPEVLAAVNKARQERGEPLLDNAAVPAFRSRLSAEDAALIDRIADEVWGPTKTTTKRPREEIAVPIEVMELARRQNVLLRGFLMGPTGSGKSRAALEIASRLLGGGLPISLVNTEIGRGTLYADRFRFGLVELFGDYSPESYIEALGVAEGLAPAGVVIVDSASHEWMGENGILQQADRFGNWKTVRPKHNAFVQRVLASPCHVIVTCRAKMKYEVTEEPRANGTGTKQVISMLGIGPIQSDDLQYEFNFVGRFDQATKECEFSGHVDSLQGVITQVVGEGADMVAARLSEWCSEGEPPEPVIVATPEEVTALKALLDAEGIPADKIEAGFAQARSQARGALTQEWVVEKTIAATKRAEERAQPPEPPAAEPVAEAAQEPVAAT